MTYTFKNIISFGIVATSLLSSSTCLAVVTDHNLDGDSHKSTKKMRVNNGTSVVMDRDQTQVQFNHKPHSSRVVTAMDVEGEVSVMSQTATHDEVVDQAPSTPVVEVMDVEGEDSLSPLTSLPYEIRHFGIFRYLSDAEILLLRRTCHRLKEEIDNYAFERRSFIAHVSLERLGAWCVRGSTNILFPALFKYFIADKEETEKAILERNYLRPKQQILNIKYQYPVDFLTAIKRLGSIARNNIIVEQISFHQTTVNASSFSQLIAMAKLAKTKAIYTLREHNDEDRNLIEYVNCDILYALQAMPHLEVLMIPNSTNMHNLVMVEHFDTLCRVLPHTNLRVLGIDSWRTTTWEGDYKYSLKTLEKLFYAVSRSKVEYLDISDIFKIDIKLLHNSLPHILNSGLKILYWDELEEGLFDEEDVASYRQFLSNFDTDREQGQGDRIKLATAARGWDSLDSVIPEIIATLGFPSSPLNPNPALMTGDNENDGGSFWPM